MSQILNIINAHFYFLKYVSCFKAMKLETAGERDVSTRSLRQWLLGRAIWNWKLQGNVTSPHAVYVRDY